MKALTSMAKVTLEQVVAEAKSLSPEEQHRLLEVLSLEARIHELRRIQAQYNHLDTSSEGFAECKSEEIELENSHRSD